MSEELTPEIQAFINERSKHWFPIKNTSPSIPVDMFNDDWPLGEACSVTDEECESCQ